MICQCCVHNIAGLGVCFNRSLACWCLKRVSKHVCFFNSVRQKPPSRLPYMYDVHLWLYLCYKSPKTTAVIDTVGAIQSATGARSATFRALIFSKGVKPKRVDQVWTAGFGSRLLTRKPMGKNWHDIQNKCNRWETLRKDRGEQWERLYLNYRLTDCSGKLECELHIFLCPQIWHFSNRLFFPCVQQLISVLPWRLRCVGCCKTAAQEETAETEREKMKAAFR